MLKLSHNLQLKRVELITCLVADSILAASQNLSDQLMEKQDLPSYSIVLLVHLFEERKEKSLFSSVSFLYLCKHIALKDM